MPKIVSGQDYLKLPSSPATWLVEPLLPSSGAMLLYGDAKVGKSFAALQLANAIQSGQSWLGFPTRKGNVVYIQLDTPRMADRETLDAWPFDILDPEHLITLRDELQALKPDFVIIDTLRESHSADENDSTEMQEAIAALVAATKPAALCLISHARKPSQESDYSLMADNRGSNYVVGRMDAIVRFTSKSARVSGRSIEEHSISLRGLIPAFGKSPSVNSTH
jgi:RecA-family ATPase